MNIARFLACCLLAGSASAADEPLVYWRVLDVVTGRPVPGVHARLTARQSQPSPEIISDANGEFGAPVGDLALQKEGYRDLYRGYGHLLTCCEFEVDARGRAISLLYLMPQIELSGTLLKPGGGKAANTEIMIQRAGTDRHNINALAFEEGRYITTDKHGEFRQRIDAVDTDLFAADELCGTVLLQHVRLVPGEDRTIRFTIPKRPHRAVRGMVSNDVSPIPSGEIQVELRAIDRFSAACSESSRTILAQSGGAFSFKGVPPGQYIVNAALQPHCYTDTCGGPGWNVYRKIEVTNRGIQHVDLALHPNLELTGTMHWEGKQPGPYDVPEVNLVDETGVWYHPHGASYGQPANTFLLTQVQPGRYGLKVDQRTNNFYLREVQFDGKPISGDAISIAGDAQKARLDLYFSANVAHLQVTGLDPDRRPAPRYTAVMFSRPEGPYSRWSIYDSAIAPGDYYLLLLPPDLLYLAIRPDIVSRYMDHAVRVSLSPGQSLKIEAPVVVGHPLAPK
jgi:hypothetical protein